MKFSWDEIIQQYAAILEYGQYTARSTSALQFPIKDIQDALNAAWIITELREDKGDVWKLKYQNALEDSYLHMAIFIPQEDYEVVALYESLRQAIADKSISDVKRREDLQTLGVITPKYIEVQRSIATKMRKLASELQEIKNTLKGLQEVKNTRKLAGS